MHAPTSCLLLGSTAELRAVMDHLENGSDERAAKPLGPPVAGVRRPGRKVTPEAKPMGRDVTLLPCRRPQADSTEPKASTHQSLQSPGSAKYEPAPDSLTTYPEL